METEWKLEQAQFKIAEAEQITTVNQNTQAQWRKRGILQPKAAPHGFVTLAEALQMLILSSLTARGIRSIGKFAKNIKPTVDYAVAKLASAPANWRFEGSEPEEAAFKDLFGTEGQSHGLMLRLLGLSGKKPSRYVVIGRYGDEITGKELHDLKGELPAAAIILDGKSVANYFACSAGKALFTAAIVQA